jgi:hypothetical protein
MKVKKKKMSKIPFEIVKIENKKAPLFLELPVPPYCYPILVGGSKTTTLKWMEKATQKHTVLCWSVNNISLEEVSEQCILAIKERAKNDNWNSFASTEEEAIKRLKLEGIEKVKRIDDMVVPQEHDLLGTIIIFENKFYPVIHNSIRAICFIENKE